MLYKPYINYNCTSIFWLIFIGKIEQRDVLETKLKDEVETVKTQSNTLTNNYQSMEEKQLKTENDLTSLEKRIKGLDGHLDFVSKEISDISKYQWQHVWYDQEYCCNSFERKNN